MFINAHSYYSLRYGTLSPQGLVKTAKKWGIATLVLTDINNTSASFAFIKACKMQGIKPVLGIEFRRAGKLCYIGIAKNNEGFYELNQFLSQHSLQRKALPVVAPPFQHAFIIYPQVPKPIAHLTANEYIGIRPEQINTLFSSPLKKHLDKLVALSPITFLDTKGYNIHRILRAIDLNTIITKLTKQDIAAPSEVPSTPDAIKKVYQLYPQIIDNTEALIGACSIDMQKRLEHNRQTFSGSKEGDYDLLEKLALNGCKNRYGEYHQQAKQRVKKELEVIHKLGFCCYFLITWDIIRYAREMGYYHVGRGSGANSIVAYALGITDVEPIELALYFERFINQFRVSPPDFDIDFSWDQRDDVIDYVFKRYGPQFTALLATYSTFKGKSIVREVGKVFGLPKGDIDLIIDEPEALMQHHGLAKKVLQYGGYLEGFPNYLSIHAGGILISEKPINYHTALQLMPKGFPIVHFDMYGAEDLGFHKYDILSQRGLGHIKDAVTLIGTNQKQQVNIHDMEAIKQNPRVRALLKSGNCLGCFYIESPAMRGLLTKLQCDTYVHLVAASSIIRPGVAKSGMMREYIRRFHDPSTIQYLHPVFEEHLSETFGVMVYQEDVMKVVHHFAGLDLDESDVLRRIMSGKRKSSDKFDELRQKYFVNCKASGYSSELSEEVWRQVESFSGYSFCKAHSASFAAESFQSLFLKAYYPLEFMVAVINNFGGFYHTEIYFHEARMLGGMVHAPCINKSQKLTMLYRKDIYVGFIHLHQLERKTMDAILEERQVGGPFTDLENFIRRVMVSSEQLDILIRINAFRYTRKSKYELMWEKNRLFNPKQKQSGTGYLFGCDEEVFTLPILEMGTYDHAFDEIELLGFPLCSPFELLEDRSSKGITVSQMTTYANKQVSIVGYFITRKNVRTSNNKMMCFGTWIDREGRYFDTTHFPPSLKRYPLRGKGLYFLKGTVVLDFGFPSIEVSGLEKLSLVQDGRY